MVGSTATTSIVAAEPTIEELALLKFEAVVSIKHIVVISIAIELAILVTLVALVVILEQELLMINRSMRKVHLELKQLLVIVVVYLRYTYRESIKYMVYKYHSHI